MINLTNVSAYRLSDSVIQDALNPLTEEDYTPEIYFRDIRFSFTGYGHWRVTIEIDIDGRECEWSTVTTDSMAIDDANDDDDDRRREGYLSLFNVVISDNEESIIEYLQGKEEEEEEEETA